MSPLIFIVRAQGNWLYESLINSMISKVLKIASQKKTNSRKNWKKKFFAQETKPGGGGFNILQKKIANETKS